MRSNGRRELCTLSSAQPPELSSFAFIPKSSKLDISQLNGAALALIRRLTASSLRISAGREIREN